MLQITFPEGVRVLAPVVLTHANELSTIRNVLRCTFAGVVVDNPVLDRLDWFLTILSGGERVSVVDRGPERRTATASAKGIDRQKHTKEICQVRNRYRGCRRWRGCLWFRGLNFHFRCHSDSLQTLQAFVKVHELRWSTWLLETVKPLAYTAKETRVT